MLLWYVQPLRKKRSRMDLGVSGIGEYRLLTCQHMSTYVLYIIYIHCVRARVCVCLLVSTCVWDWILYIHIYIYIYICVYLYLYTINIYSYVELYSYIWARDRGQRPPRPWVGPYEHQEKSTKSIEKNNTNQWKVWNNERKSMAIIEHINGNQWKAWSHKYKTHKALYIPPLFQNWFYFVFLN